MCIPLKLTSLEIAMSWNTTVHKPCLDHVRDCDRPCEALVTSSIPKNFCACEKLQPHGCLHLFCDLEHFDFLLDHYLLWDFCVQPPRKILESTHYRWPLFRHECDQYYGSIDQLYLWFRDLVTSSGRYLETPNAVPKKTRHIGNLPRWPFVSLSPSVHGLVASPTHPFQHMRYIHHAPLLCHPNFTHRRHHL